MSTTLDPTRLRWLLKRLHSDFPGVDYATLVRSVMQVEQTSDSNESLEAYCTRVRDMVKKRPEAQQEGLLRSAKIVLHRTVAEPHFS